MNSLFQERQTHQDIFDTVLFAIGRKPLTEELKPENIGLQLIPETAKIDAIDEQTNVPNVYADGDVLHVSFKFWLFAFAKKIFVSDVKD